MRLSSVGILLGLAGMLQPFTFEWFRPGFLILMASAVLFMIASHMAEPSTAVNAVVVEEMPPSLSQPTRPDNP
jgi:hypothetical protein